MENINQLTKLDKQIINTKYGNIKNYKEYHKTQKEQGERLLELDERINSKNILSSFMDSIQKEEENRLLLQYKMDIKNTMRGFYKEQYSKWMIVWDLLNNSYYEIKNSIKKGKIAISDIIEVVQDCNAIHNIFDIELIMEFVQ